jgi:hypothetical protein
MIFTEFFASNSPVVSTSTRNSPFFTVARISAVSPAFAPLKMKNAITSARATPTAMNSVRFSFMGLIGMTLILEKQAKGYN